MLRGILKEIKRRYMYRGCQNSIYEISQGLLRVKTSRENSGAR